MNNRYAKRKTRPAARPLAAEPVRDPQGRVQAVAAASAVISTDPATGTQEIVVEAAAAPRTLSPEDRKDAQDSYREALLSYDKTIVTVSSGALALSITFLHDLASNPLPSTAVWLWVGWGGLLGSLLVIIFSMLTGHVALERHLKEVPGNWFTGLTTWLNIVAAVGLLVGFFGLAQFAKANMFAPKADPVLEIKAATTHGSAPGAAIQAPSPVGQAAPKVAPTPVATARP